MPWINNDGKGPGLFCRTAFETLKVLFWQPDLIHVNDWPGALVPYYLKTIYKDDEFFKDVRTVLTIHNIAYQGVFGSEVQPQLDPEGTKFNKNHPAWDKGNFNFLKAGIQTADVVTTVSPTYAKEIVSKTKIGMGLGKVAQKKGKNFLGILNGINYDEWNPETDEHLEANYTPETIEDKQKNRDALIELAGLKDVDENTMIIGWVSRLVHQKGVELLDKAISDIMKLPVVFVVLGKGHPDLKAMLEKMAKKHKGKFYFKHDFDEKLAHQIEAGSDVFLMPSEFEPCGLNQMYSLRYGTPPIVHKTGGLADTVSDFKSKRSKGNGFVFAQYKPESMLEAITRASKFFQDKDTWTKLMLRGMAEDNSWESSTQKLMDVYKSAAVKK